MKSYVMSDERFRQRLMYRMMQIMALEQPCRLGETMQAIFAHSPVFFDPDVPSNAGPISSTHTQNSPTRCEMNFGCPRRRTNERISDDVRETLHEDW